MSTIDISSYWKYGNSGLMLQPEKQSCTVNMTLKFDGNGVWDQNALLMELENALRREMGLAVDLAKMASREAVFMEMIKNGILEDCLHPVGDILSEFSLDTSAAQSDPGFGKLNLVMNDTGCKLVVDYRPGGNGRVDCGRLLQAWRGVIGKCSVCRPGLGSSRRSRRPASGLTAGRGCTAWPCRRA